MMEQMCGMSDHNNEIQFTANLRFTVGLQYLLKISYVNFDHNRFSKIYILNRKNWIEFSIQSKLL